jgi:hypothetical protein
VNRASLGIILFVSVFVNISCATSMTPSQFLAKFPNATNSDLHDRQSASEAISNGKCKLIVEGHKYTSPIGLTVNDDLQNGAAGVDEWVRADGGNAYILNNFEWISVGDQGITQLIIYFDTMLCE